MHMQMQNVHFYSIKWNVCLYALYSAFIQL